MPHVEMRKATVADAEVIAPRMRRADVVEVHRSAGFLPLEALVRSLMVSEGRAHTLVFNGVPSALWGLAVPPELMSNVGVPWLLATDEVTRYPRTVIGLARTVVEGWQDEFATLLQFVDEENTGALRFLRALGFAIHPPVIYGAARVPFCPVVRSRHV